MAEKFFVIGSNSFTGASFVDFLLGRGDESSARAVAELHRFFAHRWANQRPWRKFVSTAG
jgi:hypothetical protein